MRLVIFIIFTFLMGNNLFSQWCNDTLTIGHDTTLCAGQSVVLHADQAYISYLWNTNSTASSITVTTPGIYSCAAKIVDSANIVINGDFDYGNLLFTSNYVYGTGGSYGLLSNDGQYAISTNASLTHVNFSPCTDHTTGTGNFMIVNGSAVANQSVWCQTVAVVPATDYIFSAWFTSVHSSNPAILNFSINNTSIGSNVNVSSTTCLWQNFFQTWTSGPTQISANICIKNQNVNPSGNDFAIDDIYFAQVCEFHDTVTVLYNDYPNVDLGNDTLICEGDTVHLDASADSISTYLWNNSSVSPFHDAFSTDTLWVEVANGNCKNSDTIVVETAAFPVVDLGSDTLLCSGSSLILDAENLGASYLWQDNSTNAQLVVTSSGTYWVDVFYNIQCVTTDSIDVLVGNNPTPFLEPDQAFCEGDSVKLDPGIWNQYAWSNGSSMPFIWVKPSISTQYGVVVWDAAGCFDSTSTDVTMIPMPQPAIMSNTDTICFGSYLFLNATGGQNYIWNNGANLGDTWQVVPSQPDIYTVTATNSYNNVECSADTSIFIFAYDCNTLFMPTAFSPNGDGINDDFGPVGLFNLEIYEFYIYSRWGQLVFSTLDVSKHWDGKDINGNFLNSDVFTYVIRLKEPLMDQYEIVGTVQLIR